MEHRNGAEHHRGAERHFGAEHHFVDATVRQLGLPTVPSTMATAEEHPFVWSEDNITITDCSAPVTGFYTDCVSAPVIGTRSNGPPGSTAPGECSIPWNNARQTSSAMREKLLSSLYCML